MVEHSLGKGEVDRFNPIRQRPVRYRATRFHNELARIQCRGVLGRRAASPWRALARRCHTDVSQDLGQAPSDRRPVVHALGHRNRPAGQHCRRNRRCNVGVYRLESSPPPSTRGIATGDCYFEAPCPQLVGSGSVGDQPLRSRMADCSGDCSQVARRKNHVREGSSTSFARCSLGTGDHTASRSRYPYEQDRNRNRSPTSWYEGR